VGSDSNALDPFGPGGPGVGDPGVLSPTDLRIMDVLGWTPTPPTVTTVSSLVASGSSIAAGAGDLKSGSVVTLTLNMSAAVNVSGTPTLTLNDGGTASYVSGTGSSALTFSYTVAAGQNTADLTVTAVTGTIADLSGNAADLTGAVTNPAGTLQIDTTAPNRHSPSPERLARTVLGRDYGLPQNRTSA
jgi:hypothetical protein